MTPQTRAQPNTARGVALATLPFLAADRLKNRLSERHIKYSLALLTATFVVGTLAGIVLFEDRVVELRSRLPSAAIRHHIAHAHEAFRALPYFADKRNAINRLFVKKSWGWTTLSWAALLVVYYVLPAPFAVVAAAGPEAAAPGTAVAVPPPVALPPLVAQIRRFVLATLYWYYATQATWFFGAGPSLTHRVLTSSGAVCTPATDAFFVGDQVPSGGVCSGARGEYYTGGHDVSGHVFMMVHCVLFLVDSAGPLLLAFVEQALSRPSVLSARTQLSSQAKGVYSALLLFVGLWTWMLLMTCVYFHTPLEKFTGFVFGLGGWVFSQL